MKRHILHRDTPKDDPTNYRNPPYLQVLEEFASQSAHANALGRETVHLRVGRMHVEVRKKRRADEVRYLTVTYRNPTIAYSNP